MTRARTVLSMVAVALLLGATASVATAAQGSNGGPKLSAIEADEFYPGPVAPGQTATVYAECADGKYVVSGGWQLESGGTTATPVVLDNSPSVRADHIEVIPGDPEGSIRSTAWQVTFRNDGDQPLALSPWSVCVNAG